MGSSVVENVFQVPNMVASNIVYEVVVAVLKLKHF